jgi:hypothetical protein
MMIAYQIVKSIPMRQFDENSDNINDRNLSSIRHSHT